MLKNLSAYPSAKTKKGTVAKGQMLVDRNWVPAAIPVLILALFYYLPAAFAIKVS